MTTHREQYLKSIGKDPNKSYSLREISNFGPVSYRDINEIYNRGRGAWKTNIRSVRTKGSFKKNQNLPRSRKLSAEQWGYARVMAFLNKLRLIKNNKLKKINQDNDIASKYL
jgi:hypothetical protein